MSALARAEHTVQVSFEFPGRPAIHVAVGMNEAIELTGVKHPYKVQFWVHGGLAKAKLEFDEDAVEGRRTITAIDGVRNGPEGTWVYFVDNVRSRYHINTQTAPTVRSIRFVFEETRQP